MTKKLGFLSLFVFMFLLVTFPVIGQEQENDPVPPPQERKLDLSIALGTEVGLNTFYGQYAGYNTTGEKNTFLGCSAGRRNTTGYWNTFIGESSGYYNTTGHDNTFLGSDAGELSTSGYNNTFIGSFAGVNTTTGYTNTYIGKETGWQNQTGHGNVFIGYQSGYNESGSNKLYIDASNTSTPLIYGDFNANKVAIYGALGVGIYPTYPLQMSNGAYCSTGGVWTNASSRELKENIEALNAAEADDALNKLNPVKYNYKVDKSDKHVGFIAEDAPDLVASADKKGMSPMDVVAVLTKVVQDLKKENLEQRKIIADLQDRMATLEKK